MIIGFVPISISETEKGTTSSRAGQTASNAPALKPLGFWPIRKR
jgi:hypothetical protein